MSSPTVKHVIRMGPITVLALVIVLSLATMAVLSFATAQAAGRMVDKQQAAQEALYENERQAQEFMAELDQELAQWRGSGTSVADAIPHIEAALDAVQVDDNEISKSFSAGTRKLTVHVLIGQDFDYSIKEWKTQAELDSAEDTALWMG